MNLLIILGCLLVGLIVLVTFAEKSKPVPPEVLAKMQRWFMPLIALSALLSLILYTIR